jgi:hypothetical protein
MKVQSRWTNPIRSVQFRPVQALHGASTMQSFISFLPGFAQKIINAILSQTRNKSYADRADRGAG